MILILPPLTGRDDLQKGSCKVAAACLHMLGFFFHHLLNNYHRRRRWNGFIDVPITVTLYVP